MKNVININSKQLHSKLFQKFKKVIEQGHNSHLIKHLTIKYKNKVLERNIARGKWIFSSHI